MILLDAVSDQKGNLTSIQATTSNIAAEVRTVDQRLAEIQTSNARVERSTTIAQSVVSGLQGKLDGVSINTQSSAVILRGVEKNTDIMLSRVDEGFRMTQSGVQDLSQQLKMLQLALISRPGLQRDVCDELQVFSGLHEHELQSGRLSSISQGRAAAQVRRQNPLCNCSGRTTSRFRCLLPWPCTTVFCSTKIHERHHQCCPFYSGAKTRNHTVGVRIRPSNFLASTLELSLSLSRGAGGTAISPTLVYRPIVPANNPAFSLFKHENLLSKVDLLCDHETLQPDLSAYLSSYFEFVLRELPRIFKEREASPFDRTENGETLIHVSHLDY